MKYDEVISYVENAKPMDFGVLRVKTTETHHIDVIPMIYNDRIVCTPVGQELEYDRYWCYDKGQALIYAAEWDGSPDTEPRGWKKSYDGRRGEEHEKG